VAAHASATPEQPALAFPTAAGPWRWASWAWLAWRVAVRSAEIAGRGAGEEIGYRWLATPGRLVTDLAIQAAGRVASPLAYDAADEPASVGWDDQPEKPPWGELPRRPPAGAGGQLAAALRPGGGAAVVASGARRVWNAGELAAAAAALGAELPRPAKGRALVLVGGDLAQLPERAWLSWALATGAVVALAGSRELLPWALAWSRPTHVCVPAADLGPLLAALHELESERGLRRRLKRLTSLVAWGGDIAADALEGWGRLGVTPRSLRP
jgi:hypothetical protein